MTATDYIPWVTRTFFLPDSSNGVIKKKKHILEYHNALKESFILPHRLQRLVVTSKKVSKLKFEQPKY